MDGTELANAGDHAALNFLNTSSHPWGEPIELLGSGRALLSWLVSTGLLDDAERGRVARRFSAVDLDAAAAGAREAREWLRGEVEAWVSGGEPGPAAVKRLNRVLAADPRVVQLEVSPDRGAPELQLLHRWTDAAQLIALPLGAAAELFAEGDRALVRACDGHACEIWFYDRTKSHRRRWCSMAVCGNRDKVRNHRDRERAASAI